MSRQIESPIIALGNFIDNAVQAFYDQVISAQKAKRGEPLTIDFTITKWMTAKQIDSDTDKINGVNLIIKKEGELKLQKKSNEENKVNVDTNSKSEDVNKSLP